MLSPQTTLVLVLATKLPWRHGIFDYSLLMLSELITWAWDARAVCIASLYMSFYSVFTGVFLWSRMVSLLYLSLVLVGLSRRFLLL